MEHGTEFYRFFLDGEPVVISREDAIRWQEEVALSIGRSYESEEDALLDFIAENNAVPVLWVPD